MSNENSKIIDDRTVYLIVKLAEKANKFLIRQLSEHDLKGLVPSHGDILVKLFQESPLTMKRLAREIGRDKSTITTLVDKLVGLGYVRKEPDPVDNRAKLVSLTKKGKALLPEFKNISVNLQSKLYSSLSDQEKETLVELLSRINKRW